MQFSDTSETAAIKNVFLTAESLTLFQRLDSFLDTILLMSQTGMQNFSKPPLLPIPVLIRRELQSSSGLFFNTKSSNLCKSLHITASCLQCSLTLIFLSTLAPHIQW